MNKLLIIICLFLFACSIEKSESPKPNILYIMVDDMGYSDLGCYGGEIQTPNIDKIAESGIRFSQFYNTAKCMTSRACLLTGLYAQQCGMDENPVAMTNSVTLGEVLKKAGYRTFAAGKHHGTENLYDRGFDHYYGLRDGACNYWNPGEQREGEEIPGSKGRIRYWCDDSITYAPYTPDDKKFYTTDVYTNKALEWLDEDELAKQPFFLYVAYQAPHYPLHAWPEDIAKYKGKYDQGYKSIRKERYRRMVDMGLIDESKNPYIEMDNESWGKLSGIELEKEIRRMEIYAAMLDRADQNIGKILNKLEQQGKLQNTIIMFSSDNGGCAELSGAKVKSDKLEDFGNVASYEEVGENWATVQNTPLRYWKNYSHEGGIRTPFIVSWPDRLKNANGICTEYGHLIDVMPTIIELTGAEYPKTFEGREIIPMQGVNLMPALEGEKLERNKPLFWQWKFGGAVRNGNMKAVFWEDKWELHDMSEKPNETNDLSQEKAEELEVMKKAWQDWYTEVKQETP